jgi:hypothetical protein
LYVKCENDYVNGIKVYEAIVESKILETTQNQIESLKLEASKIIQDTRKTVDDNPIAKSADIVDNPIIKDPVIADNPIAKSAVIADGPIIKSADIADNPIAKSADIVEEM